MSKSNMRQPRRIRFTIAPEENFDPHWTGHLLKSWTLLENPGLLPVLQRHRDVKNLWTKPVILVKPQLELSTPPSDTYFSLSHKSRKDFCKIYKTVQEKYNKQARSFAVQNPTAARKRSAQLNIHSSLLARKTKAELAQMRQSRFSLANFQLKAPDEMFYETQETPNLMKVLCLPGLYPGLNEQLYAKPREKDVQNILGDSRKDDDKPVTGVIRLPSSHQTNINADVWEKLSKMAGRRTAKRERKIEPKKKFKVFNQLTLRNEVLENVKEQFLHDLKKDINTPLPPELFEDNRNLPEPSHNYLGRDEFPPQGPFPWAIQREGPAEEKETEIIDAYFKELKQHQKC